MEVLIYQLIAQRKKGYFFPLRIFSTKAIASFLTLASLDSNINGKRRCNQTTNVMKVHGHHLLASAAWLSEICLKIQNKMGTSSVIGIELNDTD
jgi:hypothetical protein